MKLLSAILLSVLLVFATTSFSQDTNTAPEKGKPALSEVQGHGFGGPALQRGWDKQGGPKGPMFRGGRGPEGRPEFRGPPQGGPRGPMMGQRGHGGQRGPAMCPKCHKQVEKIAKKHQKHMKKDFGPRHQRGF